MSSQTLDKIKGILKSNNYDNHVLIFSNDKLTIHEITPYGKVEITSHDNKAKQMTVTENIRL